MSLAELRVAVFDIPLTTRFRGIDRRQGILVEGPAGWAEWSPFPEYDDAEAATWLACTHEIATRGLPAPVRDAVPVNAIIPALPPEAAARRAVESGCTTAKVKVAQAGETVAEDVARVAAVREALGPDARIRVDANGAWGVDEALAAIEALAPYTLEYVEQPCATVPELAAVRREIRRRGLEVLVAADESIRRVDDPLRVVAAEAADLAVIKVQPLGGPSRALALARQLGLPVVVSSAVETSVGLAAGVALAAALPELPHACGLETASLLADDVVTRPLVPRAGVLGVDVPEVDEAALRRVAAAPDVAGWWLDRLARAERLLPVVKEST